MLGGLWELVLSVGTLKCGVCYTGRPDDSSFNISRFSLATIEGCYIRKLVQQAALVQGVVTSESFTSAVCCIIKTLVLFCKFEHL